MEMKLRECRAADAACHTGAEQHALGGAHRTLDDERDGNDGDGQTGRPGVGDAPRGRGQDEERHRHEQRELLGEEAEADQDAGGGPRASPGAGEGAQREAQRQKVLRVEGALHACPDHRRAGREEGNGGLPAGPPPLRGSQQGDDSGHEGEPTQVPDLHGRADRLRGQRPRVDDDERVVAARAHGGSRRKGRAVPDMAERSDATREQRVERRSDAEAVRERTCQLAVRNSPCTEDGLEGVAAGEAAEARHEDCEQCSGQGPAQGTPPSREWRAQPGPKAPRRSSGNPDTAIHRQEHKS